MSNHDLAYSRRGLAAFLREFAARNSESTQVITALFFTHRQADMDALCAAHGFGVMLGKIFSENDGSTKLERTIVAPQGASILASSVCAKLGVSFVEGLSPEKIRSANLIAVLDLGDPGLLGDNLAAIEDAQGASKILVDHHVQLDDTKDQNPWKNFDFSITNSRATSTSEIIALEFDSEMLDQDTARVLLAGLLFDSQHLGIANQITLEAALKLTRAGAKIDETKELLRSRPERSEIVARLKSAQRVKYVEKGPYFVAESEVSSFHASVARLLVEIGADVGIACGTTDSEARVSLRSSQRFFRETGVDLGKVLNELARSLNISGGGHSTAASVGGKIESSILLARVKKEILDRLP